jgi:hypothetical protein
MLAADVMAKTAAGSWEPYVGTTPAHKEGSTKLPAGGNEVFIDGSARWIKATQPIMFLHTWRGNSSPDWYFYQDDLGTFFEARRNQIRKYPN